MRMENQMTREALTRVLEAAEFHVDEMSLDCARCLLKTTPKAMMEMKLKTMATATLMPTETNNNVRMDRSKHRRHRMRMHHNYRRFHRQSNRRNLMILIEN